MQLKIYCWFSHDVTKIQTTKLWNLPRFYFHDVLEQLKNSFHTNFRFKRVLGFVIEYAWISKLLGDAAFTWRPRELSCKFKKMTSFRKFCYLNSSSSKLLSSKLFPFSYFSSGLMGRSNNIIYDVNRPNFQITHKTILLTRIIYYCFKGAVSRRSSAKLGNYKIPIKLRET